MAKGFLIAGLDFTKVADDEYHDWQDKEHLPERLRIPGFISAQRWIGVTNPKISINTYDLESPDVLQSAPYLAISGKNSSPWSKRIVGLCTRVLRVPAIQVLPGDATQPDNAQALLFNAMNISAEHEADFNAWFREDHLPALTKVTGTLCGRFFRSVDSTSSHQYVVVYHLTGPEVPDSPDWKKAASTPWSDRVVPNFRDRVRIVCRRYVPAK